MKVKTSTELIMTPLFFLKACNNKIYENMPVLWFLPLMAAQSLITSLQTDTCNFCESKGIEYIFKNQ